MRSRYQRLLPGTIKSNSLGGHTNGGSASSSSMPTCSVNPIACERCRRKKAKCDGQRPTCGRCLRNGTGCQYDADVGESRSSALKRKHSALEKEARQLRKEAHHLKRLYSYIGALSEDDAYKVFRHIRTAGTDNPIDALRLIARDEHLKHECVETPDLIEICDDTGVEPLRIQLIKVPALPWSTVASDDVVSELISQYFAFDYLYVFPQIPQPTFVDEMRSGDVESATCCSTLLVNAICAQQCMLSPKQYLGAVLREQLAEAFLREANRLLQTEEDRTSLANSQAVCLMYAAMAAREQLSTPISEHNGLL